MNYSVKMRAVATFALQARDLYLGEKFAAARRMHEGEALAEETIIKVTEDFYRALDAIADILAYMDTYTFAEAQRRGRA